MGAKGYSTLNGYGLTDRSGLGVNVANGNLLLQANDLGIAGTGLPLAVNRTYNNLSVLSWDVGNSWALNTGSDIELVLNGNGQGDGADLYGANWGVFFPRNPDGSFTSPTGIDATLVHNGDGSYTLTFHGSGLQYHWPSGGGLMLSQADKNGNTISYGYNQSGNMVSVTDTQGRVTTFAHTSPASSGLITTMTDPSGRTWQYGYDSNKNLTSYTDPNGKLTQYGYDSSNELVQITDPNGTVTTLAYDGANTYRLTSLTLGAGSAVAATWSYAYNAGNTVVTDPNNHTTTYYFDYLGRVTKVTDALGNSVQQSWTADSHPASTTDALGHVTSYGYDANNNLTQVTLPPAQLSTGVTTSAVYGAVTNIPYYYVPTSTTDAQGNTTTYTYDGNGNRKTVSMPAMVNSQTQTSTITVSAIYNANGTIASSTDFNGNTTSYRYDARGNLTTITPPSYAGGTQLGPTSIVPDALSRPSSVTDGNGHTTTYTYDPLNRVTNQQFPDGSVASGYDADGNQTSMTDSSGTTSYSYDAHNRQTQKVLPAGGGTFNYGYDAASNLTSYQDAGGAVGYAYNQVHELTTLTEPGGAQTTFAYDANHNRTSTVYPDGVTLTQTLDAAQRLTNSTARNASTTLTNYSYSFTDPNTGKDSSLVWQVQEQDNPNVGPYLNNPRNWTTTDSYDPRGLLLTWLVKNNANGSNVHDYEYQYDANGNRTQIVADATVSSPPPNPKTTLAYNAVNELQTTTLFNSGGGQVAQASWTWDANANLTGNSGYPGISNPATLTYNQHNQTTSITDVYQHPVTMTYAGAGQGERTSADWSNNPTGKTPEFGHTSSTNSSLGLMSRTDSTGTTYYTYDPSGLPVSERTPGGTYYYVFDGQGNVAMLVDPPSGAPVAITSPCPTNNQSGDQWEAPGTHALDEEIHQGQGATGAVTDLGTGNVYQWGRFSGASGTGFTQLPTIPPFPLGIDLNANIKLARTALIVSTITSLSPIPAIEWWTAAVASYGPWDYKAWDGPQYDAFGNFNFGATGAALGLPSEVILQGTGAAQTISDWARRALGKSLEGQGQGNFLGSYPRGDDPRGQDVIQRGIDYYYAFARLMGW